MENKTKISLNEIKNIFSDPHSLEKTTKNWKK